MNYVLKWTRATVVVVRYFPCRLHAGHGPLRLADGLVPRSRTDLNDCRRRVTKYFTEVHIAQAENIKNHKDTGATDVGR